MGKKPTYEELEQRIKELEKINNEFSQKEAFFREFFEDDLTGDFITDSEGLIIQCNPAFLKIFGFNSLSKILNHNIVELYPDPSERTLILELLGKNRKIENYECIRKKQDGSLINVNENIIATFNDDGNITNIKGYIYDITERILAEKALRDREKDLNASQKIAHLGSWHLDLATNQVEWTEELYYMYGFDPTLPPPPYTEHMKLFTPESWEKLSAALARTIEKGIPYELELETVKENGTHGWMWVHGEREYDSARNTIGLWGAAQDITERIQAEKEKEKLIVELEEALKNVKQLSGLFPICSHCKKIRDDKGYWNQIESYIHKHSNADFSHSICPDCAKKYYPDLGIYDD